MQVHVFNGRKIVVVIAVVVVAAAAAAVGWHCGQQQQPQFCSQRHSSPHNASGQLAMVCGHMNQKWWEKE